MAKCKACGRDDKKENREIDMCYTAVINKDGPGFTVGIVKKGEKGYYKTDLGIVNTWDDAVKLANKLNAAGNVSELDAWKLTMESMRKD